MVYTKRKYNDLLKKLLKYYRFPVCVPRYDADNAHKRGRARITLQNIVKSCVSFLPDEACARLLRHVTGSSSDKTKFFLKV